MQTRQTRSSATRLSMERSRGDLLKTKLPFLLCVSSCLEGFDSEILGRGGVVRRIRGLK